MRWKPRFVKANAKTNKLERRAIKTGRIAPHERLYGFGKLSGHTCPFAKQCKSSAIRVNGRMAILDGPHTVFRCFSASAEVRNPSVYANRQHNSEITAQVIQYGARIVGERLAQSIPLNCGIMRLGLAGDFSIHEEMLAWIRCAQWRTDIHFYGYTKCVEWLRRYSPLPSNMTMLASFGGWQDDQILDPTLRPLRHSRVVASKEEAASYCLPVDDDDYIACYGSGSTALVLHGPQPIGFNPEFSPNKNLKTAA